MNNQNQNTNLNQGLDNSSDIKKENHVMADAKNFVHGTADMAGRGIKLVETETIAATKKVKNFWHMLGPGLTTGASDDDPSGIATYSQTGAQYGFKMTWLALFTFPLMATVQEMCARIGMVTGQGLAANIRQHHSRTAIYFATLLLLIANIFNIGADLGAMTQALQLVVPGLNFGIIVISFGIFGLLMQIFMSYTRYAKYLKYLTFTLFAYVITAFYVDIDWGSLMRSLFTPNFDFTKDQFILVCAILGTTISPYLFFWQTSQEVEMNEASTGSETKKTTASTKDEINSMRTDVWFGMFISNLAMFFIISVAGATLFQNGITNINTAADAASALRPFAGDFAYLLFAIGIIGVGLLAIPVLAGSAAYAVSESFGWKFGLNRKLKEARAFYGVISLAVIVGIILNFVGLDPIKALIYSAVLNGIVAPFILYFIVRLSSRADVMGERKNRGLTNAVGWITVCLMSVAAIGAIYSLF